MQGKNDQTPDGEVTRYIGKEDTIHIMLDSFPFDHTFPFFNRNFYAPSLFTQHLAQYPLRVQTSFWCLMPLLLADSMKSPHLSLRI